MVLFLTSSPSGPLNVANDEHLLDYKNGFVDHLKRFWKEDMKALMVCAFPDNFEGNNEMTSFFYDCFNHCDCPLTTFDIWDYRVENMNVHDYDLIILAGGHVPTQKKYFDEICLKDKLKDYEGIIIGVSAGSMNSAHLVYSQPEMEGESIDPNYQRFILGLGLTNINVLPHYQMVKDYTLDDRRLFEDITYSDSYGHEFIALEDGSYLLIEDGNTTIYGNAYRIFNGVCEKICDEDETLCLGGGR